MPAVLDKIRHLRTNSLTEIHFRSRFLYVLLSFAILLFHLKNNQTKQLHGNVATTAPPIWKILIAY